MFTYNACKKIIERRQYLSIEDMTEKVNVFYLYQQFTKEQYEELISMLLAHEAEEK